MEQLSLFLHTYMHKTITVFNINNYENHDHSYRITKKYKHATPVTP